MRVSILTIAALLRAAMAAPVDDGLARTPPMGWNSWETFRLRIDEGLIRSIADAIVSSGMKGAGYQYVVIDAGWKDKVRNPDGTLAIDKTKFP